VVRARGRQGDGAPAPSQLAIRLSRDVVGLTGSRGNPDLLPFLATNYDLGSSGTSDTQLCVAGGVPQGHLALHPAADPAEVNPNDGQTYQITSRSTATTR
jgi:hypothetical protein